MPTSRIPFLLATLLLAPSAIAQSFSGFKPQQQVLNGPLGSPTSAGGAWSVYATDLDGDGDADVLSASDIDDKIAWYENLTVNQNGPASPGSFGAQQVLTGPIGSPTSADGAISVYATDLDGDGDADVLSASSVDGKIAWNENQGRFPTLLGSYTGAAPGDWNFETLLLPTPLPLSGNVQFQLVYTRGSGVARDLALDNYSIEFSPHADVALHFGRGGGRDR